MAKLKAGWVNDEGNQKDAEWIIEKGRLVFVEVDGFEFLRIDPEDLIAIAAAVKEIHREEQ